MNKLIAMFEDNSSVVRDYRKLLPRHGYEVAEVAATIPEADVLIPQLVTLGIRLAMVDGNLDPSRTDNFHGNRICREIHLLNSGILVFGHPSDGKIEGADFNLAKGADIKELAGMLVVAFARINQEQK